MFFALRFHISNKLLRQCSGSAKIEAHKLYCETVLPLAKFYNVEGCSFIFFINFPLAVRSVVTATSTDQFRSITNSGVAS